MRYLKLGLIAAALCAVAPLTHADTGLAMVCKDATKANVRLDAAVGARCESRAYSRPQAATLVASCTTANCTGWAGADFQWRRFSTLAATARVLTCNADTPPDAAFSTTDPCTAKSTPYTLKTAVSVESPKLTATLTWKAPTQNEDGTPLTKLRGFYVFKSTGADLVAGAVNLPEGARLQDIPSPGQTSIELPVTPSAKTFFAMTAYACDVAPCTAATRVESKMSAVVDVTKVPEVTPAPTVGLTCTPATALRSATVTCTWSSTNADSCLASNAWAGAKAVSGSEQKVITESAMFNLACTGTGGTTNASAPVMINTAPNSVSDLNVQ